MYDLIQKSFNFKIINKRIDNIEINISKVNERIIFFYYIKEEHEMEQYVENLAYLFQKHGYKKIINEIVNDENDGNRFLEESKYTLPEFLWDLYIVFINNTSIKIPQNKKNKVERDDFFARKILIEAADDDKIISILKEILFPQEVISNLVKDFELNDSAIMEFLFKDSNGQICDFIVNDFTNYINKDQYQDEMEEGKSNLNNIKFYLTNIKEEIQKLKGDYKEIKGI